MRTIEATVAEITSQITSEDSRAQAHIDVGDTAGAVHHLSRAQVLQELLDFINQ